MYTPQLFVYTKPLKRDSTERTLQLFAWDQNRNKKGFPVSVRSAETSMYRNVIKKYFRFQSWSHTKNNYN